MITKRQTSRFISRRIVCFGNQTGVSNWGGVMSLLVKDPFVASFHGLSLVGGSNEHRFRFSRKVLVDARKGFRINARSDHFDELQRRVDRLQKARAMAPYPELVRGSEMQVDGQEKGKMVNAVEHGSPLGFPGYSLPEKLVVAVDVDEVLGNFVSALNEFIADRYSLNHSISEYHVYEFFKIWNCSRDEADIRVHEFFKTPYFKKGILPIPGAQIALNKLSKFCDLSIVTSRQNVIKDHTIEWIESHYPGQFQEIHFGNHFALDGTSRPKSDICSNAKPQSCFFPIPQAANCITRVAERANTPVIYLSTDAAESETDLLQSLTLLNGKTIPLVKRPARNSAEKWDALLYRHGLEGDAQVEAMLDKTICALSSVFIGASGSTFTEDILRLRKDWRTATVCDEYLCKNEQPNFIAENE